LKIVEIENLHSPKKSLESLLNKIQNEHEIELSEKTISRARHLLRFFYKSPKISENLATTQIQKESILLIQCFIQKKIFSNNIFAKKVEFVLI
jgi:hypothetical protein